MASLDKLSILGIRNFGVEAKEQAVIRFGVPLTLILGENGCGKTTIIECLKYAITGEKPSSFVHDPHLTDFTMVTAQVALSLKSVKGEKLNILRFLRATVGKKSISHTSLDQTISVWDANTNDWVSIGGRCADANTEMLMALGISKSIASYVLFCHQEDSFWPLAEAKTLKERFDAIFDAAKYNKCLDQLKTLSKEYNAELNSLKNDLTALDTYRSEANTKRANLCSAETRMSVSKKQVADITTKLEPIREKLKAIFEKEGNIDQLSKQKERLKTMVEGIKSRIAEYKKTIPHEFVGSDDELNMAIKNFSEELKTAQEEIEQLEKQINEITQEQKRHQSVISSEQVRIGQLTRDMDKHAENIRSRNRHMNNLSEKLDISICLSQSSDNTAVNEVFTALENGISLKQDSISSLKKEQETEIEKIRTEIDTLRENRAKMGSNIENKKASLEANRVEIAKVKADIEEVDQSAERLGRLQMRLDRVKRELDEINKNNEIPLIDEEINELKKSRETHEDSLTLLEKETHELQSLSSLLTELEMKKNDRNSKLAEAEKLRNRHQQSLKHILKEVPEQGIQFKLEAAMDKLASEVQEKRKEIQTLEKKISSLESDKNHLSDKLRTSQQQALNDESIIEAETEGKDYDVFLAEVGKRVQELQDEKGTLSSSEYLFRRYANKLQERDPCCPLCKRGFSSEDEVTKLVSELSLKVKEIPSRLRGNRDQLEVFKNKHEKLLQLQPRYEKLRELRTSEIPSLKSEMAAKNKELQELKETLEGVQLQLSLPESDEALCKSIHMDVVMLERALGDIRNLNREISKFESKLPAGKKRTLKEAMNEQKETRAALNVVNRKLESLQSKKTSITSKKHKLQEDKNSIQEEQMKITGNVQMRAQLAERCEELESLETMLNMEIDQGVEDLASLSRQLDNATRLLKTTSTKHAQAISALQNEIKPFEDLFEDIKKLHASILDYEKSGGNEKLQTAKQNLKSLQKTGDLLQEKRDSYVDQRDQLKASLSNQKVRERELIDNQNLRQKRVEERKLTAELQKLAMEIGHADYDSIVAEKDKLRREEESLCRERAKAEGVQTELIKTLRLLREELNKDNIKNAELNYRNKLIDIKVLESTINDLHYYHNAMDRAMKQYHNDRMKQVNTIIKDLWFRIYAGCDIDYIEIQMGLDAIDINKKKNSYDYKVVQVKSGVELEMRGRCSAGQKVIASLIIRMALAETFSANCGILTLDEPTTNLDEKNVANLSQVLAELIQSRRNKAFQLVVISHDREFLESLSRATGLNKYLWVDRDLETGRSKIESKRMDS